MSSVYIGTPHTRPFESGFVESLFSTTYPGHLGWLIEGNRPVDEGRNVIVQKFLQTDGEFLVMVDSDATWHPKAIERLVSRNVPVVCGGMYTRYLPPRPTIALYTGQTVDGKQIFRFNLTVLKIMERAKKEGIWDNGTRNNRILFDETPDDMWPIDGCGMHFTCIRRDVLEKMTQPWFYHDAKGTGEDFYFCIKAKKMGHDIFFDTSVHTGHIAGGTADFGLNEFCSYLRFVKDIEDPRAIGEDEILDVGNFGAL